MHRIATDATGAHLVVPGSDPNLPGVTATVPPSTGLPEIGMQAETRGRYASGSDLLRGEPALLVALNDAVWSPTARSRVVPQQLALALLMGMDFAGPAIRLEPAGARFPKPVEVSVPLALLSVPPGSALVPVLRDEGGTWEVLSDFSIDEAAGVVRVRVPHFSVLQFLSILPGVFGSMVVAKVPYVGKVVGTAVTAKQKVTNAYFAALNIDLLRDLVEHERVTLPSVDTTLREFIAAASCARQPLKKLTANVDPVRLTAYLASYEHGPEIQSGYGRQGNAVEVYLASWFSFRLKELARRPYADTTAAWQKVAWRGEQTLSYADVFGKALELTSGNVWRALVASHNFLRTIHKNDASARDIYNHVLRPYRGDGRDEAGAAYHFFGTALYAYAYASWRATPMVTSESAILIEEGIWSGDIHSDPRETAVDLQGADLGARLYGELRSPTLPPCEKLELRVGPAFAPTKGLTMKSGDQLDVTALLTGGYAEASEYRYLWSVSPSLEGAAIAAVGNTPAPEREHYVRTARITASRPGSFTLKVEVYDPNAGQATLASASLPLVIEGVFREPVPLRSAAPVTPQPPQPCPSGQSGLGGLSDALRCTPLEPPPSPRTTEFDLSPRTSPAALPFCERSVSAPGRFGPLTSRAMQQLNERPGSCDANIEGRPANAPPPYHPPRQ